jgi:hypothetical protein
MKNLQPCACLAPVIVAAVGSARESIPDQA